jgi:hypothetical protein
MPLVMFGMAGLTLLLRGCRRSTEIDPFREVFEYIWP